MRDPALARSLEETLDIEIDPERLGRRVDHLFGCDREWRLADLDPFETRKDSEQIGESEYLLSVEFLGYLYREEEVPLARGAMARRRLVEYLGQETTALFAR